MFEFTKKLTEFPTVAEKAKVMTRLNRMYDAKMLSPGVLTPELITKLTYEEIEGLERKQEYRQIAMDITYEDVRSDNTLYDLVSDQNLTEAQKDDMARMLLDNLQKVFVT